jgi:hypothetical protein
MCHRCPMVIWIVTLLDRYSSVRFLSVDDPPADMLENTPRVELAMTPSTMYSPLMPLSRCFLHLIYLPIYVFSPICQHLFEVTDLTTRGCSFFWRFQPPDARYMLSRLYRKVNPFRSDLLLLLLHAFPQSNVSN